MKKTVAILAVLLLAVLASSLFVHPGALMFNINGERVDEPLGTLLGLLFAGGGTLLAAMVMLVVGAVLAVVFAGVGVILLAVLGVGALALAAAISPLLLPLLLPLALIWFLANRSKSRRLQGNQAA
jgi:hypothetical protein